MCWKFSVNSQIHNFIKIHSPVQSCLFQTERQSATAQLIHAYFQQFNVDKPKKNTLLLYKFIDFVSIVKLRIIPATCLYSIPNTRYTTAGVLLNHIPAPASQQLYVTFLPLWHSISLWYMPVQQSLTFLSRIFLELLVLMFLMSREFKHSVKTNIEIYI